MTDHLQAVASARRALRAKNEQLKDAKDAAKLATLQLDLTESNIETFVENDYRDQGTFDLSVPR